VESARANADAFRSNHYAWNKQFGSALLPNEVACGSPTPCTSEQVAGLHLRGWLTSVRAALPDGDGHVASDPSKGVLEAWVMWRPQSHASTQVGDGACPQLAVAHLPAAERPLCVHVRAQL
jgi:hypothetical protein